MDTDAYDLQEIKSVEQSFYVLIFFYSLIIAAGIVICLLTFVIIYSNLFKYM